MSSPLVAWILTPRDRAWLQRRGIDPGPDERENTAQWLFRLQISRFRQTAGKTQIEGESSDGA